MFLRRQASLLGAAVLLFSGVVGGAEDPVLKAREVYVHPGSMYGMVAGDLDPGVDGPEVYCLLEDGSLLQLIPSAATWEGILLFDGEETLRGPHDRATIDVGDVMADIPGLEVVTMAEDIVNVFYYQEELGWSRTLAFDGSGFVSVWWGARAGDYDTTHPGDEIFVIQEGALDASSATILSASGGSWNRSDLVYSREVAMDSACGEFNPDHDGPEIVAVTEMGPAYEIVAPSPMVDDLWPIRTIWDHFDDAGWVVRVGDVHPGHPGNEIVYGTRYSNRIMISTHQSGGPHELEIIMEGETGENPRTVWDLQIGDVLDGAARSLEIVGVDGATPAGPGHAYLAWHDGADWRTRTWTDPDSALYCVATADFEPARSGSEIVVSGASGTVTLLTVVSGMLPGECNLDGTVDISDSICLLGYLFLGNPSSLPCGSGGREDPGNVLLVDWNEDGAVDVSDAVSALLFLFAGGPGHPLGPIDECVPILGCPDACGS